MKIGLFLIFLFISSLASGVSERGSPKASQSLDNMIREMMADRLTTVMESPSFFVKFADSFNFDSDGRLLSSRMRAWRNPAIPLPAPEPTELNKLAVQFFPTDGPSKMFLEVVGDYPKHINNLNFYLI